MDAISISQFLLLFSWFCYAALIYILALIARFYERFSNQATYYRWYAIPVFVMGAGTARYVSLDQWGGDIVGDILFFLSGAFLSVLCYHLYKSMTYGR
jgi:hypothetical protein